MPAAPGGGAAGLPSAVLVQLDFGRGGVAEDLAEFELLASSAGVAPVAVVHGRRGVPDPATFAGKGKVAELAQMVKDRGTELVLFNHDLSGAQQRNLERDIGCRVVDRTSLI
ncbi:MAG: GTPase HflX, partial [Rhodocyclaceae bacterium]